MVNNSRPYVEVTDSSSKPEYLAHCGWVVEWVPPLGQC